MRSTIAGILNITQDNISVKATTAEKMGFIGREEGVVALASVLLANNPPAPLKGGQIQHKANFF